MFSSIWSEMSDNFRVGNMVTRLIIINVAIFLAINLLRLPFFVAGPIGSWGFGDIVNLFCVSYDLPFFIRHPWSIVSSIFFHVDVAHILWNMVALYLFGRIMGDLLGDHRVLPVYLMGGITGCIFFMLIGNLYPVLLGAATPFMLGASAAVMAIMMTAGFTAPNYSVNLILFGPVALKYVVAVSLFLDYLSIVTSTNSGGSIAHLGGVLMGYIYVSMLRKGNDLAEPINRFLGAITRFFKNIFNKPKPKPKRSETVYSANVQQARKARTENRSVNDQERLDAILDKIKQTGYESLDAKEKDFLFNASNKK